MRSLVAGGCWLGGGVILSMGDPFVIVGALAVCVVLAGGLIRSLGGPPLAKASLGITVVLLARTVAGPAAAVAALVLLITGAMLRVRPKDAAAGVAAFSGGVSLLGGAPPKLLVGFWVLGAITLAIAHVVGAMWRRAYSRFLAAEKAQTARLGAES
jgi:hypothetical protein